jgi:hypothetical protein
MAAQTMKKEVAQDTDGTPIVDLRDKVTVYAPDNAPHHKAGEEVRIHPNQLEKFLSLGYTETPAAPKGKKAD